MTFQNSILKDLKEAFDGKLTVKKRGKVIEVEATLVRNDRLKTLLNQLNLNFLYAGGNSYIITGINEITELKKKIVDQQQLIDNNKEKISVLEIQIKKNEKNLSNEIITVMNNQFKEASLLA